MKWIRFRRIDKYNAGTETEPKRVETSNEVMLSYCAYNEEIAKREAYNGEYTIEGDGQPEADATPTLENRVGTLESDSAETREALELLLSGVTE